MKAYLINLPDATARLAHMREALGRIGVPFERFDALDPERAARHPCFPRIRPLEARPWVPGEIACLLSHYEVWRRIAEGTDEFGMVMEDDLLVDPRLKKVVDGESGIPEDADVVRLETGEYQTVALSRRSVSTSGGPAYHRLLSVHYGAGAYAICREAARLLVARTTFDVPADDLLFSGAHPVGKQLRVYQAVPGLAIQNANLPAKNQLTHLSSGLDEERRKGWEAARYESRTLRALYCRLKKRVSEHYWQVFECRMIVPFGGRGDPQ
jgi:glycosyl transferase, family 25